MTRLQRFVGLGVVLLGGACEAAGAVSDPPAAVPGAEQQRAPVMLAAKSLTMDEAVKMAEERFHARVVKAETQKGDGHVIYVLRLLNEAGRVWTVRVDAASGEVL